MNDNKPGQHRNDEQHRNDNKRGKHMNDETAYERQRTTKGRGGGGKRGRGEFLFEGNEKEFLFPFLRPAVVRPRQPPAFNYYYICSAAFFTTEGAAASLQLLLHQAALYLLPLRSNHRHRHASVSNYDDERSRTVAKSAGPAPPAPRPQRVAVGLFRPRYPHRGVMRRSARWVAWDALALWEQSRQWLAPSE